MELHGQRLEDSLRGRQGRLLFAYLAINRDRPVRRDELAEALWSGKGAPPAYESLLAPPLSRLRKALGPGVLEGRSELQLVLPEDTWIDWEVARARTREGGWDAAREAVEIADRGLLPGLEAPWIDTKRQELADLRVEALEATAHAGALLGGAALPEAEQAARAAVQAHPYRESARAVLMEVLRARGNVNEALRVYEDIRVLLREELGSSPGAALVALHQALLRDDPAPTPAAPVAKPIPRSSTLVERDREVALLDGLLQEATLGEGRAVLIEGPPGIGKSRLLAEFRRRAVAEGAHVLNARAGELEREFPFGVVRQLFEGVVTDPDALAGAAAAARVVFASPENGTPTGDASFAALHGLYWLTLNLAAERPLLLEIDDLHWCDRPSLRFLAYLVRRLEGQPVLVSASVRTGDAPTDAALMAEIANDPATAHVRPGPLSEEAVGELVAKRLGAEPDAAFRQACHGTTGGNPLLVRQLLNALETDHVRPDAAHADVVRAIGSRAVSSSVLLRLARLPGEAATVARAVAVLGESAELPTVAALSGLDEAQVAGAMAALARAEILRPEPPPGFVHPLVRDAVYTGLPLGERELLHARAAGVLRERGAPLDQVAGQLMLTPGRGDAAVARLLHEAGNAAMSRGAVDSSVGYMQRALEEPPARDDRPRLLLDLGEAEALTRGPDSALHLREAYDGLTDVQLRIRAANALGRALLFTSSPAEGSRVALEAAAALPEELADEALGLRAFALMGVPFGAMDPAEMRPVREWRGRPLETIGEKLMGAVSALEWTQAGGHVDEVIPQAFRALAGGELQQRDPNLLDARRAAAADRRRPRRGPPALRSRHGRRAPPRLAVRRHRHVPVARVQPVLARRPDRRRGGAARLLRPGRVVGLRPGHPAVERRPSLVVPDRARQPRRGAHGADAGARARRPLRRRALLVQRAARAARRGRVLRGGRRGRRRVRGPLPPLPQPRRRPLERPAGGGAGRARHEAQGDRARRRGARPRPRLGRSRHGRPLPARARPARRPGRAGAVGGGGRDRRPRAPAGSSWPSPWRASAGCAAWRAGPTTPASP